MTFSLERVETYLRDRVATQANTLDHTVDALRAAFFGLGQQHWLGLKIPQEWGGAELAGATFQRVQELIARYSGALAFLQAQHQSAGGFLSRSANLTLKQDYLPQMASGAIAVGVGFSHLRRHPPPLKAIPVPGGFCLEGTIPWITGYGIFQAFVGAAVLPDHRAVYGLLPFSNSEEAGGSIHFSDPMPLAAMTATNTVTAQLQRWFLPEERVLFVQPADAIAISDRQNVLQHSFYALGCARAGLDLMQQISQERRQVYVQRAYEVLDQALNHRRDAIYTAAAHPFETRLQLRAEAIALAGQCAHTAVILSAGAANSLHHPAQRIYREAMVFSVTGQTAAVMEATVRRMLIDNGWEGINLS